MLYDKNQRYQMTFIFENKLTIAWLEKKDPHTNRRTQPTTKKLKTEQREPLQKPCVLSSAMKG